MLDRMLDGMLGRILNWGIAIGLVWFKRSIPMGGIPLLSLDEVLGLFRRHRLLLDGLLGNGRIARLARGIASPHLPRCKLGRSRSIAAAVLLTPMGRCIHGHLAPGVISLTTIFR
jgi:hypothetical protein